MSLDALLAAGLDDGAWTQAELAVVRDGKVLARAKVGRSRLFDVASVTKVVTAALTLKLVGPDTAVEWLPDEPRVRDLLAHSTGLPPWRPLFSLARVPSRDAYRRLIAETPNDSPKPTYSDLGFLVLGIELEDRFPVRLHTLASREFFRPLGMNDTYWGGTREDAATTGTLRPRRGNPDVEADKVAPSKEAPDHGVDDDNAAALDGDTGHAGLWSTARDLAVFGDALRLAAEGKGSLLPRDRAEAMFTPVSGARTLGLDTPSGETPSIGTIFGRGPKGAAGHLGFTGCSLWIDRDAEVSIALVSNAVAVERPNSAIKRWRPLVHDAVAHVLGVKR